MRRNLSWIPELIRRDNGDLYGHGYIDRCMCQAFDVEYSEFFYFADWAEIVVYQLASGKTLEQLIDKYRTIVETDEYPCQRYINLWRVCAYLNEHFTVRRAAP
jgi:hypothetical protein